VDDVRLLEVLDDAAAAVKDALDTLKEWGPTGGKPGQYHLDLAADAAALPVLHGVGLAVLSEESGVSGDGPSGLLAVIDPVDGSTNAHRRIPFYSTSICVLDDEGPRVGLVRNHANGNRFAAIRGDGADKNAGAIRPSGCEELRNAIVGISGFPGTYPGWAQFRALGSASLELCAVAEGVLDAYTVAGRSTLYGWDYLAGLLICREVGAADAEREGRDLVVRDAARRRPLVAATRALADRLLSEEKL
jgi:myo-inositol-1(or 4)-monophosphatase